MMREEFEQKTGFFPPLSFYGAIELHYVNFGGDKDAFCKAYKNNIDGIAEKIQRADGLHRLNEQRVMKKMLDDYKARISKLEKALELEQEWKPYESPSNVQQAEYAKLAEGADGGKLSHYMTEEEAVAWICDEFDFNPAGVTIVYEIDEYEVNRHHQLRRTGRRIDRRPVYCATDYHYIRFNTSHWSYEVWNGNLRKFYD